LAKRRDKNEELNCLFRNSIVHFSALLRKNLKKIEALIRGFNCAMKTTQLPLGKDSSIDETIAKVSRLLEKLGFSPEPTSWINPTPHCWSVHLSIKNYPFLSTNGKGVSRDACLASGLMEFWERLSTNFFFSDYYLDDEHNLPFIHHPSERWFPHNFHDNGPGTTINNPGFLNEKLCKFYNPNGDLTYQHLFDNNSDLSKTRGICTLPFHNVTSNEEVYFPVSLLNNLYVSNGMAAGNSEAECCAQALSEIIERFVKNIIISKGLNLPNIPTSILDTFPELAAILEKLRSQKYIIQIKDASLGGKYPVICALLTNPENGGVYAAFGANCRFGVALERTLTELLQGRDLDQLSNFNTPNHDPQMVADPFNLESHFIDSDGLLSWKMFRDHADFDFSPWDFTGSTEEEFETLKNLITKNGYEIFRADYSCGGLFSYRLLVPGMSEIYPLDDLIWNNRITGAVLRSRLLRLPEMGKDELKQFIDLIEDSGLNDFQQISDSIGVLFDKTSCWYSLTIGELKALIYLALQQHENAFEWCHWCLEYPTLTKTRRKLFRLLHAMVGLQIANETIDEYTKYLIALFSQQELTEARSIITGTSVFPGLTFGSTWSDISVEHKKLLSLYREFKITYSAL